MLEKGEVIKLTNLRAVISVDRIKYNKKYDFRLKYKQKIIVHNSFTDIKVGDYVVFKNCIPISKTKRHIIIRKEAK